MKIAMLMMLLRAFITMFGLHGHLGGRAGLFAPAGRRRPATSVRRSGSVRRTHRLAGSRDSRMSTRRLQKLRLVMADRQGWLCYWSSCRCCRRIIRIPDCAARQTTCSFGRREVRRPQPTSLPHIACRNAGRHHHSLKEKIMMRLKLYIDSRHLITSEKVINIPVPPQNAAIRQRSGNISIWSMVNAPAAPIRARGHDPATNPHTAAQKNGFGNRKVC
jgi:hypothetical protein